MDDELMLRMAESIVNTACLQFRGMAACGRNQDEIARLAGMAIGAYARAIAVILSVGGANEEAVCLKLKQALDSIVAGENNNPLYDMPVNINWPSSVN